MKHFCTSDQNITRESAPAATQARPSLWTALKTNLTVSCYEIKLLDRGFSSSLITDPTTNLSNLVVDVLSHSLNVEKLSFYQCETVESLSRVSNWNQLFRNSLHFSFNVVENASTGWRGVTDRSCRELPKVMRLWFKWLTSQFVKMFVPRFPMVKYT